MIQKYVIGVDGGGSKTAAVLASPQGRILKKYQVGSSHPRNVGLKNAIKNLAWAIEKVKGNKKIISAFLGLPAIEEEFNPKESLIKKELLKNKKIKPIFKGKVVIGSDQLAGFRSGTDEKDGVVLVAGSGCAAHGWRNNRESKTCGWGYLSEMGSAFWVSQKALQAIWKELDGRGPKTLITKLIFKELRIKSKEDLIEKIYFKNPFKSILPFSSLVDRAAEKGDKIAKNILVEAGKELALSANAVIRELNFKNEKFPLVFIGSMFNSKTLLNTTKKEVKNFAPKVKFIRPKVEPVMGAVRLALAEVSPYFASRPDSQDSAIEKLNK